MGLCVQPHTLGDHDFMILSNGKEVCGDFVGWRIRPRFLFILVWPIRRNAWRCSIDSGNFKERREIKQVEVQKKHAQKP